jgi:hypothetical protein
MWPSRLETFQSGSGHRNADKPSRRCSPAYCIRGKISAPFRVSELMNGKIYLLLENPHNRLLTKDEARRIAANIAKLSIHDALEIV